MAAKNKGTSGDGARTQPQTTEQRAGEQQNLPATEQRAGEQQNLPARVMEPPRWPARRGEHPLSRLRDEVDAMFDRFFFGRPALWEGEGWPGRFWDVDVQDTDKEILVRAEAPGFEPQEFDIHVSGNTLTIRAEHRQEGQEMEGHPWERRYSRLERAITLPAAVDADKVEAHYRHGVLELRLPRAEEARRRRIEVKT
jgi:HSP20 family protein